MIESRMNEEQVSPMRYLLFYLFFYDVCGVLYIKCSAFRAEPAK